MSIEKIKLFYSINNGGDGSASLSWHSTEQEAIKEQEDTDEGWAELCYGSAETFVGSNIHKRAINIRNNENLNLPEKINVFYSINNGGDGSAGVTWYLNEQDAINEQEDMDDCWGEPCYGSVETFINSDIHKLAKRNR